MAAADATKPLPMEFRPLGSSGVQVPVAMFGVMTMGAQNSREESFALLDRYYARFAGVGAAGAGASAGSNQDPSSSLPTYRAALDIAELYPVPPAERDRSLLSEQIVGDWIASKPDPAAFRNTLFIATKAASRLPGLPKGSRSFIVKNRYATPEEAEAASADDPDTPDLTRSQILSACDASLRRLQTTFLDLYQLHWPSRYAPVFGKRQFDYKAAEAEGADGVPIEESVAAVGELIAQGKVKHWGVSNETPFGLCKFVEAARKLGVPPPVSIQNDYSLLDREFDGGNAEVCHPKNGNIGLIAYGCLAGGTLSGKYNNGGKPSGARHTLFPGFQPRYVSERALAATADYAAVAAKVGISPAKLALAWAASRPFMASVIIGATTAEQLDETIDGCLIKLSDETLAEIDVLYLKHGSSVLTD
jgi:aryl-alcohol dehydrogenase-like predicted oxidoreductase